MIQIVIFERGLDAPKMTNGNDRLPIYWRSIFNLSSSDGRDYQDLSPLDIRLVEICYDLTFYQGFSRFPNRITVRLFSSCTLLRFGSLRFGSVRIINFAQGSARFGPVTDRPSTPQAIHYTAKRGFDKPQKTGFAIYLVPGSIFNDDPTAGIMKIRPFECIVEIRF